MLVSVLAVSAVATYWQPITDGADSVAKLGWSTNFTVNVGTGNQTFLVKNVGQWTMNTRMEAASSSKLLSTAAISGLVKDGIMAYEDKVNKYVPWWATDPADSRSEITLAHLLSFTDGYLTEGGDPCESNPNATFTECVKAVYMNTTHSKPPGTSWAYGEGHLQFAGAMASYAANLPIHEIIEKYLYKPLNFTCTSFLSPKNPQLAAGAVSCGSDYEKFLKGMVSNTFLPKSVTDVIEKDWTQPPVLPTGALLTWFGHYSMGNFYLCYGYGVGLNASIPHRLPEKCAAADIHADPGLWGWFPYYDRKVGYYYQFAVKETYEMAGIPEYIVMLMIPVVRAAVTNQDISKVNRAELLLDGGLILRDLFTVIGASMNPLSKPMIESAGNDLPWGQLDLGLTLWSAADFTRDFSFSTVSKIGVKKTHSFSAGGMSMNKVLPAGTAGKWPAAIVVAGLVAEGLFNFEDLVSSYLPWWRDDKITIRHLLTQTSGFEQDVAVNVGCTADPTHDFVDCAKKVYEATPAPSKAPGVAWTDLNCHIQFAVAVAVQVSKLPVDVLLKTYLYDKVGMTDTTFGKSPFKNPVIATEMETTGRDYDKFLSGLLHDTLLPAEVSADMDRDWTAGASPAGDGVIGHYGMGHFFECIGYGTPDGAGAPLTPQCLTDNVQSIAGSHGWYALVDRARGFAMQVVTHQAPSKVPITKFLRVITKGVVNAAVNDENPHTVNRMDYYRQGSGLLLSEVVEIQRARDGEN